MTILCLDLGTTTGFAYKASVNIVSGFISFKISKNYNSGLTFLNFKRWLNDLKAEIKEEIKIIYYEDVKAHKGVYAAHKYGGFLAILTCWCEHHNIPYQGIGVGTIKKYIAGKGTASKNEVIEAVNQRGFNVIDHNQSDALALLLYSLNKSYLSQA